MQWTVDLEDEIASDLSVFHRIDDPAELDAARYFRLAELLASYDGAVRARFLTELRKKEEQNRAPAPPGAGTQTIAALAAKVPGSRFPGVEYRGR